MDNKLSIQSGEDMTKSILFVSTFNREKNIKLNIKYGDIQIKQHFKVKYLGCLLDKTISREAMALINKNIINPLNASVALIQKPVN